VSVFSSAFPLQTVRVYFPATRFDLYTHLEIRSTHVLMLLHVQPEVECVLCVLLLQENLRRIRQNELGQRMARTLELAWESNRRRSRTGPTAASSFASKPLKGWEGGSVPSRTGRLPRR
jgi:hypothetical protein